MGPSQRHIKSQSNTISEVSYVILQDPTNAAFITEKTMETDEEKESVRQTIKVVYAKSTLAQSEKTERQEEA